MVQTVRLPWPMPRPFDHHFCEGWRPADRATKVVSPRSLCAPAALRIARPDNSDLDDAPETIELTLVEAQ